MRGARLIQPGARVHSRAATCIPKALFLAATLVLGACENPNLMIKSMPPVESPLDARMHDVQGTVKVTVSVNREGDVVEARGSGAEPILVAAAEANARRWVFYPLPAFVNSPIRHEITYVYKMQGQPMYVSIAPTIKMRLPNKIEITAVPMRSDYKGLKLRPKPQSH